MDLDLARGTITGLIGPNGAGKTTVINLISGIERPDAGSVTLAGADVTGLAPERLAFLGLVRTFQICRPLARLTVLENLLLARLRQTGETVVGSLLRRRRVHAEEALAVADARRILERLGLWQHADALSTALSGGQKKLLELARALMLRPSLILLDEPAAGVAPAMRETLIAAIRGLAEEGVAVLIVEHDLQLVGALCSHVHVMAAGRSLAQGAFASITRDPRVVEAYLGAAA